MIVRDNNRSLEMKNFVLMENGKILLGAYIKFHRIDQNLSQIAVCDFLMTEVSIELSKGHLSELEHGKRNMKCDLLQEILNQLDIPLYSGDMFLTSIALRLFNHFCELDSEAEMQLFNEVMDKESYEYSLGFMQYYLIKLMYNVRILKNHEVVEKIATQLNEFLYLLSDEEYSIFMLYCGINQFMKKEYVSAENNLKLAENKATHNTSLKGMIYYYMNFMRQELNDSIGAIVYCNNATSEFNKTFNYSRLLSLKMHMGTCYSRLNGHETAKRLYLEVIECMDSINRANFKKVVYYNLSTALMKMGEYEDAIRYTRIALSKGFVDAHPFIYIPYSLYRLNRKEEMLEEIELAKNYPNITNTQIVFFTSLIHKMQGREDEAIECLKEYYEIIRFQGKLETQLFTLRILIEWLNDNQNYRDAAEYSSRLILLMSNYG